MSTEAPGTDYSKTVNLPQTDFPQKANLPTREPEILRKWDADKLADAIEKARANAPRFVLHDGPPYANGDIHIGHAMNKALKDFVVRYKTMKGHLSAYVPGWDCHGLPIEQKALEELRKKEKEGEKKDPLAIRKYCAAYATRWIDVQREQFKRLGVGGRWEEPYTTMQPGFEVAIIRALSDLVKKGLVYRGFKPVHWDPVFETALAEAEIEYNEHHVSPSIHVRFPVTGRVPAALAACRNLQVVIWTTTPWTLPANLGVSAHHEFEYIALELPTETLLLAKGLLEQFRKDTGIEGGTVVATLHGKDLEGMELAHPIFDKTVKVMLGEHVTLEQGTGLVHTAPAHGVEDFEVCSHYGIDVFNPVDEKGRYTDLFPDMKGVKMQDANPLIIERLKASGRLLHETKITHKYPYSWRSHKPVIMRATEQWFMSVDKDDLRAKTLAEIKRVQWIPAWGIDRIHNMIEARPDWCLSRQRSWGVPIPSLHDTKTNQSVLDAAVIDRFAELVAKEGSDCWFARPVEDFLPEAWKAEAGRYQKEFNVLDVWFDSGSTHLAVLENGHGLSWPADLYLEGADQHRGWFQTSILVAMGVKGVAPYKAVLTHGFVLDAKGQAMSKSLGNVISPLDIIKESGADVLRLWVSSEDYRGDVSISKGTMEQISGAYRRIRNTIRFLLGNLFDFNPDTDRIARADMEDDDRYALATLADLVDKVGRAYDTYEFHRVHHLINGYCVVEMGALYLDVLKDRLYCSHPKDRVRRASQTVLFELASALLRLIAPIMPFTSEEGWLALPAWKGKAPSVHLAEFPAAEPSWRDAPLVARWQRLLALRGEVLKAIEPLRAKENKVIGNSLEARVTLKAQDPATVEFLKSELPGLARLFIVSQVELESGDPGAPAQPLVEQGLQVAVAVTRADGRKCERCWTYTPEIGSHADHPTLCSRCADAVRRLQ